MEHSGRGCYANFYFHYSGLQVVKVLLLVQSINAIIQEKVLQAPLAMNRRKGL